MCGDTHHHAKGRTDGPVETQKGMRRQNRRTKRGHVQFEIDAVLRRLRKEAHPSQTLPAKRMTGPRHQRAQNVVRQLRPALRQWLHQAAPSRAIFAERCLRVVEIPLQQDCRAIVHGVRQWSRRMDPFQTIVVQGQGRKEWRSHAHRMYRGTKIMMEAGECQLHGARSSAGQRFCFEDFNVQPSPRQHDGRCQTV